MKNLEIEIKYPLYNSSSVKDFLSAHATAGKKDLYEKDTYYIPAHRDFLKFNPVKEWFRLRETKDEYSINYKNWHYENGIALNVCDEYQTPIGKLEAMTKILTALDFKEIIIVEKTRSTWIYDKVEIAIDHITQLGDFIELEAKGKFKSVDEAKNHLHTVLEKLSAEVGQMDTRGYPYRMLEKKGYAF